MVKKLKREIIFCIAFAFISFIVSILVGFDSFAIGAFAFIFYDIYKRE